MSINKKTVSTVVAVAFLPACLFAHAGTRVLSQCSRPVLYHPVCPGNHVGIFIWAITEDQTIPFIEGNVLALVKEMVLYLVLPVSDSIRYTAHR